MTQAYLFDQYLSEPKAIRQVLEAAMVCKSRFLLLDGSELVLLHHFLPKFRPKCEQETKGSPLQRSWRSIF